MGITHEMYTKIGPIMTVIVIWFPIVTSLVSSPVLIQL